MKKKINKQILEAKKRYWKSIMLSHMWWLWYLGELHRKYGK